MKITFSKLLIMVIGLLSQALTAQTISWEYLNPLPERITNNAVASAQVGDETYVYTFSGIDSTLSCDGDHLRAYRYTLSTDSWEAINALPDAMGGKIAAAANTVKDRVYIVGGYHLAPNCSEVSSDRIHVFDPANNAYLADGSPIPVPIDDQVQAVWRDSLIYVITGWSNTTNVNNVQIYNPGNDTWQAGTPVENGSVWRVFGGSGVIIGDTIYYAGGARSTTGFSATSFFRKGYINPDDPTEITWEGDVNANAKGYRMGAAVFAGQALWIGGSDVTYNFDALAYNGSGVVAPLDRITSYDPATGQLSQIFGFIPAIMDLRGVVTLSDGEYLVIGGMADDQEVLNQLLMISISDITPATEAALPGGVSLTAFPNPTADILQLQLSELPITPLSWVLLDANGRTIKSGSLTDRSTAIDLSSLPPASYWLRVEGERGGLSWPVQRL